MSLEDLSGALPWALGVIFVIWLLRRATRPIDPGKLVGSRKHLSPWGEDPNVRCTFGCRPAGGRVAGGRRPTRPRSAGEGEQTSAPSESPPHPPPDGVGLSPKGEAGILDEPLRLSSSGPLPGKGSAFAGVVIVAAAVFVFTVIAPLLEGEAERNCVHLVGMIVLLVGSGFLRSGLSRLAKERARRAREQSAGAAWLRDRDWPREVAQPIAEEGLVSQLLTVAFFTALLLPFHMIWAVDFSWWGFWVVVGLLDLLLFLVVLLVLRTVWFKIVGGAATLRWGAVPVAPGQTFGARVEIARVRTGTAPASVTLRCMRDGSAGGSISEDPAPDASPIWTETRTFPVKPLATGGAAIEVSFPIPPEAKGTNTRIERPIRWQLVIKVPTAGPDFETIFAVPIYAGR